MCHAMPFSARALKKTIFFVVDIVVKNKSKCGLTTVMTRIVVDLTNRMWFSVVYLTNRMWFSVVCICNRMRLRINFACIFKVFTNLENFENTSEINP